MFNASDTALLLGVNKSYLGTLEREHGLYARRNSSGSRVYSATDIGILRRMGVGSRVRRLSYQGDVAKEMGLYSSFGRNPLRGSLEAQAYAEKAKPIEQRELQRLQAIRDEARKRRAREWKG